MAASVYLLRCADGSYYVGSARGALEDRVAEHDAGLFGGYTAKRLPVDLLWSQDFGRIDDAIAMKRRLQGWSREKKEALIRGDYEALRRIPSRKRR